MSSPLGVCFDGMVSIREMTALAEAAEQAGVGSIWMAEHGGYRDGFASSMAFLAATQRLLVAPTAISVYSRHPMIAAMAAATLEEYAPGRTIFSLGTGNPQALREAGLGMDRPLTRVREYVEIVRALWTGEPVTHVGQVFQLDGAQLRFKPSRSIPVHVAAMGPRMLELAGEVGDGVLLSAALPAATIARSVERVRVGARHAGRDPASVTIVGFILAALSQDSDAARRACKGMLAYLLRNDFTAEGLAYAGVKVDQGAVAAAAVRGDWETAVRLIPDEALEKCALAGTPRECRRQLESFLPPGLDVAVLVAVGDAESRRLAIGLAGAAAR